VLISLGEVKGTRRRWRRGAPLN